MSPSANNSVAYPEPCTGNHDDKFFVVGFSLGQSRVPQETKGAQRVLCIPHSVAGERSQPHDLGTTEQSRRSETQQKDNPPPTPCRQSMRPGPHGPANF